MSKEDNFLLIKDFINVISLNLVFNENAIQVLKYQVQSQMPHLSGVFDVFAVLKESFGKIQEL